MKHALLIFLVLAFGCGDPPPSNYPTQPTQTEDSTLGVGDRLEVRVFRQEEMSGIYEVSNEGTLSFPLIGVVQVAEKTPANVEREITERLADGFLKNPSVSVIVKESRSKTVSVLGEVAKPMTLPFVDGMTVIDAIANAGGFTPMARKNAVNITRKTGETKEKYTIPAGDIGAGKADNFYCRPGDVVFVPRRVW